MMSAGSSGMQARPLHLVFQEELLRGMDPRETVAAAGATAHLFSSAGDWKADLAGLEAELAPRSPMEPLTGKRVAVFCSLQAAAHIRRNCPHLSQGILQDESLLAVHRFSGILPRDWLLNRDAIMLPFGQVSERASQLEALFGGRLFMRPDCSKKAFSGSAFAIGDLDLELSALRQIFNIHDDTLVVIDRARRIAPHEYRFWISEGRIVTFAAYAFEAAEAAPPCPAEIQALACAAAERLELWANPVVADFVLEDAEIPRLVELNGFSTSGFYPGAGFGDLVRCLDQLLW